MVKSKIFRLVLPWVLAALLVVGNCLPVMAATTVETTEGMQAVFSEYDQEKYPYCIIYKRNSSYYALCTSKMLIFHGGEVKATGALTFLYKGCSADGNVISFDSFTTGYVTDSNYSILSYSADSVVAANYDVTDGSGNVVFQKPPEPTRLQAATEGIQMTEVLKEILAMIPLLIPLLAGYLGLRKALNLLSTVLRTA